MKKIITCYRIYKEDEDMDLPTEIESHIENIQDCMLESFELTDKICYLEQEDNFGYRNFASVKECVHDMEKEVAQYKQQLSFVVMEFKLNEAQLHKLCLDKAIDIKASKTYHFVSDIDGKLHDVTKAVNSFKNFT